MFEWFLPDLTCGVAKHESIIRMDISTISRSTLEVVRLAL